ncbi:mitochondrial fission ELM1 family protein [Luteimonas composti]|uniref:Mitochondrial fission ELM1 family protein n=1 Tax=Luteimonas composti TaxID=398257 RepID=A0ABT6MS96_9GAMM|nr:mitochondrial fission ELM1 family protein [Luteimonas composti]MDH7452968.1 mitochondrial fission ELM1 family protein [Luteimonas composti]
MQLKVVKIEQHASKRADSAQIWTFSDGRAGNARQADALAAALGGQVRSLQLTPRAPWRWVAPRILPGAHAAFGPDFAAVRDQDPALAIGCGRQAALATRLLRGRAGATVQILDPRIDPRHWDIVVAPEHDRTRGANVVHLIGSLHPVDDEWLAEARAAFPQPGSLPGPRTALLLGGPTANARFDADSLDAVLARLRQLRETEGGSLLATASRRTPPELVRRLRAGLDGVRGLCWAGPADGANPYPGLLAWADRIVCSPDSVNMVSEACATRVPVHVFGRQLGRGRQREFLDAVAARGRTGPLDQPPGAPMTPLRETPRVAADIRQRLGWPGA